MTLPIAAKCLQIQSPVAALTVGAALIVIDTGGPITLLVLGILGAASVVALPAGGYWTMIGIGSGMALFSIISWSLFLHGRKQEKHSEKTTTTFQKNSQINSDAYVNSGWEEKIHCNSGTNQLLAKLKDHSPSNSSYEWILFLDVHHTRSDLFFTADGPFWGIYSPIMQSTGKLKIFVCPQDAGAEERWEDRDYFKMLAAQEGMQEFQEKRAYELTILSCQETYAFNGWLSGSSPAPKPVKQALGLK